MKIKYLGPPPEVNVAPYGPHKQDEVKEYPDEFAEDLLATSKKQHFEAIEHKQGGKGESPSTGSGSRAESKDEQPQAPSPSVVSSGSNDSGPKGEIEAVSEEKPAIIPVEIPLEDLTVAQLIQRCENCGIQVPKKARKAELIKLLEG